MPPLPDRLIAPIIRHIDRVLRERQGIFEYDDDERCVFRLSVHPFEQAHQWPDGTRTAEREIVGELHLWNEHLAGLNLPGRGGELRSRFDYSMRALARRITSDTTLRVIPGFFAESWVPADRGSNGLTRVLARWGFRIDSESDKFEFLDQIYARLLARAFNPGTPRGPVRHVRIWIPRDEVMRRYDESPVLRGRRAPVAEDSQRRLTAGG